MSKCIYAHDPSDEFCCDCDGITLKMENGDTTPATKCGGYVADVEENKVKGFVEEDVSVEPTLPVEEVSIPNPNPVTPEIDKSKIKGITKEIRISSSVSKEVQGQWFKLTYEESRIVPEDADLELERKALWDTCNNEVDNQIKNIL